MCCAIASSLKLHNYGNAEVDPAIKATSMAIHLVELKIDVKINSSRVRTEEAQAKAGMEMLKR